MKKLTVYSVYLEDRENVFRVDVPAENEQKAKEYVSGNGDILTVKPCVLQDIDCSCLADTLLRAGWGQMEIDVICRTLDQCGLRR